MSVKLLHIPRMHLAVHHKSSYEFVFALSFTETLPLTRNRMTLTLVVQAVIVVVLLVVVLHGGRAAGAQLCQSAAGGGQLGAEVGHFLAGRLDGPIDPPGQLLVVFHHFKDFPLRTKSTENSMVSGGA